MSFIVWAPCENETTFFSIFSFGQVNYMFHKLSSNSKHFKSQLNMSMWQIFCSKWIVNSFSCILWEVTTWGLKDRVPKRFVLPIEFWIFTFFIFLFMMSSSMWPLGYDMKDLIFLIKVHKVYGIVTFGDDPSWNKFQLSCIYKSEFKIWAMCAQHDIKVMCKIFLKKINTI